MPSATSEALPISARSCMARTKMELDAVVGVPCTKMLVDLDELRAQFRPHAQVGEALAKIVDGDLEAAPAIVQQGLVDAGQIGDRWFSVSSSTMRLAAAQFAEQAGVARSSSGVEQAGWRDVEKQSGQALGSKARRLASRLACSRSKALCPLHSAVAKS